jgi:hypothetical protein
VKFHYAAALCLSVLVTDVLINARAEQRLDTEALTT